MRKETTIKTKTLVGVHTHTHTGSASGYLRYKKIIENIKTHVLYMYFGIPKYV